MKLQFFQAPHNSQFERKGNNVKLPASIKRMLKKNQWSFFYYHHDTLINADIDIFMLNKYPSLAWTIGNNSFDQGLKYGVVCLFNGISIFMGYLMPKSSL